MTEKWPKKKKILGFIWNLITQVYGKFLIISLVRGGNI